MHFEVYADGAGEWRWRLKARNGRIIADGAEGYKSKAGAKRAVIALRLRIGIWTPPIREAKG